MTDVLFDFGRLLLREGDPRQAATLFLEDLDLAYRLGAKWRCAVALQGLAEAASQLGQQERATRLLGAAGALRAAIGAVMLQAAQEDYDRALADLRARLDDDTLAEAWAVGRAMTLEEAIAEAGELFAQGRTPPPTRSVMV